MKIWHSMRVFLLIMVLAFLTRAPQIFSPMFYPDGDECVVGLMAKHIADGKDLPVYFYGQKYGFALFEALPAALAYKIFGVSAYTLKLTMLFTWCIGLFLFFLAFRKMGGNIAAWAMLLLMLTMPAWETWSMKARGGYNTAFLCSAGALYLFSLMVRQKRPSRWQAVFSGVIIAVILTAQPLWLPGLFLFFLYITLKKWSWKWNFAIMGGFAGGYGAICLLAWLHPNIDYWHPSFFGWFPGNFKSIPHDIYEVFHGSTTIFNYKDIGAFTDISTACWCAVVGLLCIVQVYRLISKKYYLESHLFFAGALLTLFYLPFLNMGSYNPRHLLPFTQLVAGSLALECAAWYAKGRFIKAVAWVLLTLLVLTGAASSLEFRKLDIIEASLEEGHTRLGDTYDFIHQLQARNIHFFYALNPITEWQLIFLSRETLIGKSPNIIDRYQPYVAMTNNAYFSGKPFAIIGSDWQMRLYINKYLTEEQQKSEISSCRDLWAYLNPQIGLWESVKKGLPK